MLHLQNKFSKKLAEDKRYCNAGVLYRNGEPVDAIERNSQENCPKNADIFSAILS